MSRKPLPRAPKGSTPAQLLVSVSEDMRDALKAAAKARGTTVSEYVRRAVTASLQLDGRRT